MLFHFYSTFRNINLKDDRQLGERFEHSDLGFSTIFLHKYLIFTHYPIFGAEIARARKRF